MPADDQDDYVEGERGENLVGLALGEFVASKTGDASGLLVAMVQQNYQDYSWTMNQLMEGYKRELARERARVQLITSRIERLCSQPWVPNPRDILEALDTWRYDEQVERLAEELLKDL